MKKIMASLACLCMLVALVGCGGSSADTSNTLVVAKENDIESLDLLKASSGMDFEVLTAFTEGLVTIDANSEVQPGMATSWDISEDLTVYTFHLRDAKWSNGDDLTANDFVYSWQRSAKQAEDYRYFFSDDMACIKNGTAITSDEMDASELGIKAVDDKTVEVTLSKPTPYFLSLMAFPTSFPMNQKFVEEKGDSYGTSADNVIACGPYQLTNYVKGSKLEFKKNESYYDASNISLDGLTMNIVKEASTAAMDFDSGNTDFAKINSSLVDKYKDQPTYQNILEGYLWFLQYNLEDASVSNAKIRRALSLAVDRTDLVQNVLKDGSIEARGFVPSEFAYHNGTDYVDGATNYITTDVAKAQQLFAEGLAELGVTSLEINILHETSDPAKPAAEFIQSQLTKNLPGLTVTLTGVEKQTRTQRQEDGDFQVTLTRWGPDYADPTTYLALMSDSNFFNYGKFNNAAYAAKLAEVGSATDYDARWQACKDAEAILFEDANWPVAPLFQVGGAILVNENVKGIEIHTFGTPYNYRNVTKTAAAK